MAKKIQGFNQYVRTDMCESMLGLYNLVGEVNRRKLLFLGKLCTLPPYSVPNQIFYLRYFMYFEQDNATGFMADIWKILIKYGLNQFLTEFINTLSFPTKQQWKKLVNKTVFKIEERLWHNRVESDPDFQRYNKLQDGIQLSIIYRPMFNNVFRKRGLMTHIARLWVMKPSLVRDCCYCGIRTQDILLHVIADCPYLRLFIQNFLYSIQQLNSNIANEMMISPKQELLVKLLNLQFDSQLCQDIFQKLAEYCFNFLETVTASIGTY